MSSLRAAHDGEDVEVEEADVARAGLGQLTDAGDCGGGERALRRPLGVGGHQHARRRRAPNALGGTRGPVNLDLCWCTRCLCRRNNTKKYILYFEFANIKSLT